MSLSPATLGLFTIARLAALAVIATEALFLYRGRRAPAGGEPSARLVWSITPALILASLCFWCTLSVAARESPRPISGTVAQR